MSTGLFRLVYCSRNTIRADRCDPSLEVTSILAASRANNARIGVTGALLYSEGCFAQALEGPLDAVQQTFERIQRDPRHGDVVVLQAGHVAARLFGGWDMALAESADPASASAILDHAIARPDGEAGADVVELLERLVRDEAEWAPKAA
jgi:hypothetical protein